MLLRLIPRRRKLKPENQHRMALAAIYFITFFYAFHFAIPAYVESSFIEQFTAEDVVGIIFAVGAIIAFFLLVRMPTLLRRYGNYRVILALAAIETLALLLLAFVRDKAVVLASFAVHHGVLNVILFNIDSFLESYSSDSTTGGTRGFFLTVLNIALIAGPVTAGLILTDGDFWKVFLASAIFMLPLFYLLVKRFRHYEDPEYDHLSFIATLQEVVKNPSLYRVTVASWLLYFFYVWMIIYVPIYFHKYIGLSLSEIVGIIMPIALLPFVLFQFALGKLADSRWGEKEVMTAGFVIAAGGSAAIAFIATDNVWIWAAVMFLARTGASFVEVMAQSYFYKQIDGTDVNLISFFRALRPVAYLTAPVIATFFLTIMDIPYQYLFAILGLIMLWGIRYSLTITDTR